MPLGARFVIDLISRGVRAALKKFCLAPIEIKPEQMLHWFLRASCKNQILQTWRLAARLVANSVNLQYQTCMYLVCALTTTSHNSIKPASIFVILGRTKGFAQNDLRRVIILLLRNDNSSIANFLSHPIFRFVIKLIICVPSLINKCCSFVLSIIITYKNMFVPCLE